MTTAVLLISLLTAPVQPHAAAAPAPTVYEVIDLGPERDGGAFCFDALGNLVARDERVLGKAQHELTTELGPGFEVRDHERPHAFAGTWVREVTDGEAADETVAFVLDANGLRELRIEGQKLSHAHGIARTGLAVGEWIDWAHVPHGFVADQEAVYDLDALVAPHEPWTIVRALDVAADGCIVACGSDGGERHLLLLCPAGAHAGLMPPPGGGGPPIGSGSTTTYPHGPIDLSPLPSVTSWCNEWGFESGVLGGWQCARASYGAQPTLQSCASTAISVVTSGNDPRLLAAGVILPRVPAGGDTRAARIGDATAGEPVVALRRTFTVLEDELFYQWAFVFQDFHANAVSNQPYFAVTLRSASNTLLFQSISPADSTTPGFINAAPGLGYRPWSCERIDLSAFMGQSVTLEMQASDCFYGVHWGYAYVDFPCSTPVADAGPDFTVCDSDLVAQLSAVDPDPNLLYMWSSPSGPVAFGPTANVPIPNLPCTAFPFELTVTDPVSGCSDTAVVSVDVAPDFELEVVATYECDRVVLTAVFTNGCPTFETTYSWSGGETTREITVYPDWYYNVPFTVTATNGCYTHQATGYAGGAPYLHLIAPNSFSPNGDGVNDRFVVTHLGIPAGYQPAYHAFRWEFIVWDRWGQQVIALSGQAPPGEALANQTIPDWDGRSSAGTFVQEDVYTYKLYLWDCDSGYALTPVNGEMAPALTVVY